MSDEFEFTNSDGDTWELPAGEWSRDDAVLWSFMEGQAQAEAEAEKRHMKWLKEIIEESHQERSNKNDQ